MRVAAILCPLEDVPVDFLADPDGIWEFDTLVDAVGFEEAWGQISIGALSSAYRGFPEGAAVVVLTAPNECSIALVDCTVRLERRLQIGANELASRAAAALATDVAA